MATTLQILGTLEKNGHWGQDYVAPVTSNCELPTIATYYHYRLSNFQLPIPTANYQLYQLHANYQILVSIIRAAQD